MMRVLLVLVVLIFGSLAASSAFTRSTDGHPTEQIQPLKRKIMGLEFYLQDKKDYKEFCPHIEWIQPKLKVYKKNPKSYLPQGCKAT